MSHIQHFCIILLNLFQLNKKIRISPLKNWLFLLRYFTKATHKYFLNVSQLPFSCSKLLKFITIQREIFRGIIFDCES